MKLLIIGGSDAGISAALRVRELDQSVEVTVLLADDFPNYSICGLPFFLSGETPDWHSLAHRTEFEGIEIRRRHRATHIDAASKKVAVSQDGAGTLTQPYDKLLIATGAGPAQPRIEGWQSPGVFLLHTMQDSFDVHHYLESAKPKRVVIVGAGYIGLEMADALTLRGIEVIVACRTPTVLATVDAEFGTAVADELGRHGVKVYTSVEVHSISRSAGHLHVSGSNNFDQDCEMVLIAVGVKPNSSLGIEAGLNTGAKGALAVNRKMESTLPDIYVAGDCGETFHRLLNRNAYLPLGTTAHKQGRIAAENALGGNREFAGSLGTQVVKIFNLVIARTGLRQDEAERKSFHPFTSESTVNDHKAYYPGATQLRARITGDIETGRLLGAQLMGAWGAEVSKRVDVFAAAIFHGMTVEQISDLDLSYTPPLSSPWDPVQMASQSWCANVSAIKKGIRMYKVIFACVHNAGRSQMAAAFFNQLADRTKANAVSAGTEPGVRVHPEVLAVMQEIGIDLSSAKPKKLTDELAHEAQLLITMGCGDKCPYVPGLRRDDWPLRDPKGLPIEEVRSIRDEIRQRVLDLLVGEEINLAAVSASPQASVL